MSIVRLDKVQASYNGNLESIKSATALDNGTLWVLGGLVTNEREACDVAAVATGDLTGLAPIVLFASAEVEYDAQKSRLSDFQLDAGEKGRAYHLNVGDVITVTSDLFTGTPTEGQFAVPATGVGNEGKYAASLDGSGSKLVFRVEETTELGYAHRASSNSVQTAYVLKVVKNS
jgi:hypothetical protein